MTHRADAEDFKGVVHFVLRLRVHDLVYKEADDGPAAQDDYSSGVRTGYIVA